MRFKQDSWEFVAEFGPQARDMLAALLDQSVDCVKILDSAGRIEFMNRNGRGAMEIDDFPAVAGQTWDQLWPEAARATVRQAIAAAQAGRGTRFEAFCPTAKGTAKWWDVSVTPVRDGAGKLFAILSLSRDVSDRHHAMESLETMAQEMRHRLRNAYAVSGAVALASGREEPDHAQFAARLAKRLSNLSASQSSLIDPGEGERLPALIGRLIEAFANGNSLIRTTSLPPILLGEQAVRLVALVIGELVTNSLKHGALGAGRQVSLAANGAGDTVSIEWREALGDARHTPLNGAEGSGFRLMRRMAQAHGGAFEVAFADAALIARLDTPVAI